MKKRFNFGRLGALALALTLVTSCLTGVTLAKYTTSVSGTGTATVAKWKVNIKANNTAPVDNKFEFTLSDTTTANKDNIATKKVAPGSTGSIPYEIDATGSEVAATLSCAIDTKNLVNIPIKFYSDSAYSKEITETITKDISVDESEAKLSGNIYWKWVTSSDSADTAEGSKDAADTETVLITLKAEQKIATSPVS